MPVQFTLPSTPATLTSPIPLPSPEARLPGSSRARVAQRAASCGRTARRVAALLSLTLGLASVSGLLGCNRIDYEAHGADSVAGPDRALLELGRAGDVAAERQLGACYEKESGEKESGESAAAREKAIEWYRRAAEKQDTAAQTARAGLLMKSAAATAACTACVPRTAP